VISLQKNSFIHARKNEEETGGPRRGRNPKTKDSIKLLQSSQALRGDSKGLKGGEEGDKLDSSKESRNPSLTDDLPISKGNEELGGKRMLRTNSQLKKEKEVSPKVGA